MLCLSKLLLKGGIKLLFCSKICLLWLLWLLFYFTAAPVGISITFWNSISKQWRNLSRAWKWNVPSISELKTDRPKPTDQPPNRQTTDTPGLLTIPGTNPNRKSLILVAYWLRRNKYLQSGFGTWVSSASACWPSWWAWPESFAERWKRHAFRWTSSPAHEPTLANQLHAQDLLNYYLSFNTFGAEV